jgi:hypothetical protein
MPDADRNAQRAPQTSSATSTTRASFRHWSSSDNLLPWCVLANPHCGDRHRFSNGTYCVARSMLRCNASLLSICPSWSERGTHHDGLLKFITATVQPTAKMGMGA